MSLDRNNGFPVSYRACTFFLCALVLAGGQANAQTAVVAVWSPRELFIGADSKVTVSQGETALGVPGCKIQQIDSFLFSAAGRIIGIKRRRITFDAFGLARQVASTEGPITEKATRFARVAADSLAEEVAQIRGADVQKYHDTIRGRVLLSVLFAGLEGRTPVLVVIHFREQTTPLEPVRIEPQLTTYGTRQDDNSTIATHAEVFLGSQDEIRRRVVSNPNWWRLDVAEGIRRLIEAEAKHNPRHVGPPIDIVVVDRDGARWVERKAQCPAIRPPLAR